jgi:FkbM family methyltransferase
MSTLAHKLRRYPWLFDRLNQIGRRLGHQSPLYAELSRVLPSGQAFTFLQIGANDGISYDPFREFMIRPEAHGIAVEPVPEYHRKVGQNYRFYPRVLTENCAVGYPAATLPFFAYTDSYLEQRDFEELAGLAGFDQSKLVGSLLPGENPAACIRELAIPVRTVEQVLDRHGFASVDCLFMDCEGHEENILTHLDFERVRPRLIVFEHAHFGSHAAVIEAALAAQGFQFTRLQFDTIATR